jgi:hypothetical protein
MNKKKLGLRGRGAAAGISYNFSLKMCEYKYYYLIKQNKRIRMALWGPTIN